MDKNNNSNNMLNNLLPLFMNQGKGDLGGGNNNMLTMLLPMLMQKGGGGGSSDMLKTLIPAMTGNNPQMAQMLKNMNFGGATTDDEPQPKEDLNHEYRQQNTSPCKNNNKGRHSADYSKLYPDINNMDLHKMPKIDDFKKDEPASETNDQNNNQQPFGNNSLMTLLTLMQNMKNQPNSTTEERILAVDGIAPPKIKKSLKAILALNNIIKD